MNIFHKIAKRHFPDREILGNGSWLLLSECAPDSPVFLFPQESDRAAVLALWVNGKCGAGCVGRHIAKRIRPQPQYVFEKDRHE